MKKAGLIYATESGRTEVVGDKICTALWENGLPTKIMEVGGKKTCALKSMDLIVLGTPTYGLDEAFDEWAAFEYQLKNTDLSGKTVALYGLGDQVRYPDSFLDAMGWLFRCVKSCGACVIGEWPTIGYSFNQSAAVSDDGRMFCGLGIDEHNQSVLTRFRITNWVAYVVYELNGCPLNRELCG